MYKVDDEEYKKRLQRAQELRENFNKEKVRKEPEMVTMKVVDKRAKTNIKDPLPKLDNKEIKKSEILPIKQSIDTTQTVQLPNNSTDKLNITRPSTSNLSFQTINPSNVKISSEEEKNNPNKIAINTSDILNEEIKKGGIDKFNAIAGNTLNSFSGRIYARICRIS